MFSNVLIIKCNCEERSEFTFEVAGSNSVANSNTFRI